MDEWPSGVGTQVLNLGSVAASLDDLRRWLEIELTTDNRRLEFENGDGSYGYLTVSSQAEFAKFDQEPEPGDPDLWLTLDRYRPKYADDEGTWYGVVLRLWLVPFDAHHVELRLQYAAWPPLVQYVVALIRKVQERWPVEPVGARAPGIEQSRAGRPKGARMYPDERVEEIVGKANAQRKRGVSWYVISHTEGISESTLRRWRKQLQK